MKGCFDCGCFWNTATWSCEEGGVGSCYAASEYDRDEDKCNECYPEGLEYRDPCRDHCGGADNAATCDLIASVMGGEGKWDEAINIEKLKEHHTWKAEGGDWIGDGGYWERNCAVYNTEYGYCEQQEESEWDEHFGRHCMELRVHYGYVKELMLCDNCENPSKERDYRRRLNVGEEMGWTRRDQLPVDHKCYQQYQQFRLGGFGEGGEAKESPAKSDRIISTRKSVNGRNDKEQIINVDGRDEIRKK